MSITIVDNLEQLYKLVAGQFVDFAKKAIQEKGKFVVALSGGSSPKAILKLLSTKDYAEKIDWQNIYFFWVDERWVPLTDEKSNAKMTFETLLDKVPVDKNKIFPMFKKDISPKDYAVEYENEIRNVLGDEGQFDLVLLGMGDDGHTASLFPGEEILNETAKWVDAYFLAPQDMHRITLTAPIINKAENVLVVAFGESKKHALNEVLNGDYNPQLYPLQLIKPEKKELQIMTTLETLK